MGVPPALREELLGEVPSCSSSAPPPPDAHVNGSVEIGSSFATADDTLDIITGYKGRYGRVLSMLILQLLGWLLTRATCRGGLPSDCNLSDQLTYMSNIQIMFTYGLVQAWMCNMLDRERFWHVFHPQRWYFFFVFFGSGPLFSYISDLPFLQTSFSSGESYSAGQIVVFTFAGLLIASGIAWHVLHAWNLFDRLGYRQNFWVYLLSRGGAIFYFLLLGFIAIKDSPTYEIHHYFIAFALSLFGSFSHPTSLIWLAATSGIFVQGIGAYQAKFLFYVQ